MNLKQKLAVRSTLVCAFTLLLVFGSTFYFYRNYTINYFYNKLENSALLSAIIYLEKDELNKKKYQEYEQRYLNALDNEVVQIYNDDNKVAFMPAIPDFPVTKNLLERIRKKGKENYMAKGQQYAGLFYEDNQGSFVIISSGEDVVGQARLFNLSIILVSLFLVGVMINYILNVFVARKTFQPFSAILSKVSTITTNNLNSRLPMAQKYGDELSELVSTLNMFLDRLESGVNTQKQFLKNVSHELKTPLAAIIGEAELSLSKEKEPAEYQRVLSTVMKKTLELNSVIEGLLLIAGLANMDARSSFIMFRVDELLWEVLEKFKFKYPEAEISILLEVEESDLLELHSHPGLVSTAITNLVDNAIKFSYDQKVTIVVQKSDSKRLELLVKDRGYGIQEEEQEKIFELFYRGTNTQYHKPGHGIGLSLTKHIAEFCKIDLSISSTPDQETEVKMVFPA